jgi:hypothetical protein
VLGVLGCFIYIFVLIGNLKIINNVLPDFVFFNLVSFLPIPGEAKAKAMPGWLYIHTINQNHIGPYLKGPISLFSSAAAILCWD